MPKKSFDKEHSLLKETQQESENNLDIVITTIVYVLTFLFVGVPLWWKTTEVYRYPIPHSECQDLLTQTVKHTIFVKILLDDSEVKQGVFWEELMKLEFGKYEEPLQPTFNIQWSMSIASDVEASLIKKSRNISELNDSIEKKDKRQQGEVTIAVLNKHFPDCPKFVIGTGRHAFMKYEGEDGKQLAQDVLHLFKKMVQVEKLQKLFTAASSHTAEKSLDKDRMRHLKTTKSFDITFSLIVPEPQVFEVNWNIESAVNEYLKDVVKDLQEITSVKIKSQILLMTLLPIPTHLPKNKDGELVLPSDQLPSLINPVEDKLGSDTSLQPNLNFVLYIPSRQQSPLRISDADGKPLSSNAFLLPQWGGFMIYNNHLPENASLPHRVDLDMSVVMKVFFSQFRLLLGLLNTGDLMSESVLELTGPVIREWEKDFLLRKNAQDQISFSVSSLSSLSHLLRKIRNIVIHDDIGKKVQFALSSVKESIKYLSEGYLLKGHKAAQNAFVASDEAFYDPSLLRLLYFPEDQKYAIYIPLFLPISIPVVMSLTYLWQFWKKGKLKSD